MNKKTLRELKTENDDIRWKSESHNLFRQVVYSLQDIQYELERLNGSIEQIHDHIEYRCKRDRNKRIKKMLTYEERIRALKCNLKSHDWSISPQFRLEQEDAEALLGLLNKVDERLIWDQSTEQ